MRGGWGKGWGRSAAGADSREGDERDLAAAAYRDCGGRVESWRGEGGDAVDAGAVVVSCPQKYEGGAEGEGGEAAQREPNRERLRAFSPARRREKKAHARDPGSRTSPMRAGHATAHGKRMGNHDPA